VRGAADVVNAGSYFPRMLGETVAGAMGARVHGKDISQLAEGMFPGNQMDPGLARSTVRFAGENAPLVYGGGKAAVAGTKALGRGLASLRNKGIHTVAKGTGRLMGEVRQGMQEAGLKRSTQQALQKGRERVRVPAQVGSKVDDVVEDIAKSDATLRGLTINNQMGRYGLSRAVKALTGSNTAGALVYTGAHPSTRRSAKALMEKIKGTSKGAK